MAMSRTINIDSDDDSTIDNGIDNNRRGGIDNRTDFVYLDIKDNELARLLQAEESRTGETRVDEEFKDGDLKDFELDTSKLELEYVQAQHRGEETRRRKAEDDLAIERLERTREHKEELHRHEEKEKRIELNIHNRLEIERAAERATERAAERAAVRAAHRSLYMSTTYDRIYNWSISLLPDNYNYVKREEIRGTLSDLIKRELGNNRSEYELKYDIQKLIKDAVGVPINNPPPRRARSRVAKPKTARQSKTKSKARQSKTKPKAKRSKAKSKKKH